jgi:hypothetical protein
MLINQLGTSDSWAQLLPVCPTLGVHLDDVGTRYIEKYIIETEIKREPKVAGSITHFGSRGRNRVCFRLLRLCTLRSAIEQATHDAPLP